MKNTRTQKLLAVALALFVACVALVADEVQPLEEHFQAARAALEMGDTDTAERELKISLQENPLHALRLPQVEIGECEKEYNFSEAPVSS
jgi:outer membrane protein assembly factor BamD (BamD/ComL family)